MKKILKHCPGSHRGRVIPSYPIHRIILLITVLQVPDEVMLDLRMVIVLFSYIKLTWSPCVYGSFGTKINNSNMMRILAKFETDEATAIRMLLQNWG